LLLSQHRERPIRERKREREFTEKRQLWTLFDTENYCFSAIFVACHMID